MNEFNIVEGNEELLEDIYPTLDEIFIDESHDIKKKLKDQALWGSMRIITASLNGEVVGLGIATVNNLNTGHVEYILIKGEDRRESLEQNLSEKLIAWLKWLKVKSTHVERKTIIW